LSSTAQYENDHYLRPAAFVTCDGFASPRLKVPLDTRDPQQLLELLWALRQCVETAPAIRGSSRHSRKAELGIDQTRASRGKLLNLDEGERLPFFACLACNPAAPTVVLLVSLELQDNHRTLGNLLKKFRVVKEILIELLNQEGMPFLKLLVHGLFLLLYQFFNPALGLFE
jgi:hypothetical protein